MLEFYFFVLEFDIGEFHTIHYSILHDIAINNYYKGITDEEKFLDIIDMLKIYGGKDISVVSNEYSPMMKKHIIKK